MEVLTQIGQSAPKAFPFYTKTDRADKPQLFFANENSPGFKRKKKGKGFSYFDCDGQMITDKKRLERIRKLVIPPHFEEVWICSSPFGHIQVTGRDERGRKQYKFHEKWVSAREADTFDRLPHFGRGLPGLRKSVDENLNYPLLEKQKIVAAVVGLLEKVFFGPSADHEMKLAHAPVHFHFSLNDRTHHVLHLEDRRIFKILKKCSELPGQVLFGFLDDKGISHTVSSDDVNAYLELHMGYPFTVRDMRAWAGSLVALKALREFCYSSEADAKEQIYNVVTLVSEKLDETRALCRKCYIHPAVFQAYLGHQISSVSDKDLESQLLKIIDTTSFVSPLSIT